MKKLVSILLVMAMLMTLCGVLSACREDEPPAEAPKIPIVKNGAANYIIVYPDAPTATEIEAANLIKETINDLVEIRLKTLNEEFMDEEPGANVIYVGNTTFEPAKVTKARISETYFDSYAIDAVEKDIYIVAASDTALINAAKYFVEEIIEKNFDQETKTIYFEGCLFEGKEVIPSSFSQEHLRDYSIIYSGGEGVSMKMLAKTLQTAIKDRIGFAPEIYKDTEREESRFEILLGETNRALSARCYTNTSRIMEYEYVVEQCQLQMAIGGYYSGEKCVEFFTSRMLRSDSEPLASGSYHKTLLADKTQVLTSGADIRIMSANVLAYRWGEKTCPTVLPVSQRCEIFAGVLLKYQPDAVGMQETDQPWLDVLPWYLTRLAEKDGVEYSHLFGKLTHEGKTMVNFSTIAYRSDLYTAEEVGCEVYSIWNETPSYFQRVAGYIKLTSKTDATKEFVLVNTHWAHESTDIVNACATEEAALVNSIKEKYKGVSVFCTGDFNNLSTRPWGDQYLNQFVSDVGGKIASSVAKANGVLITPGGCRASLESMRENVLREVDDNFIDHIVCTGGEYAILRHDTIRDNKCHILSDHSPIYADIDLKKGS